MEPLPVQELLEVLLQMVSVTGGIETVLPILLMSGTIDYVKDIQSLTPLLTDSKTRPTIETILPILLMSRVFGDIPTETEETVPELIVPKNKFNNAELQILPTLVMSGLLPLTIPKLDKVDLKVVFGPTLTMLGLMGPQKVIPLDNVQPVNESDVVKVLETTQKKKRIRSTSSVNSAYKALLYTNFIRRADKFVIRVNNFLINYENNSLKHLNWKKKNLEDEAEASKYRSKEIKDILERQKKEKEEPEKEGISFGFKSSGRAGGEPSPAALTAASAITSGAPAPEAPTDFKGEVQPNTYPITDPYNKIRSDGSVHKGVDLGTPTGTYIAVKAKSKVIEAGYIDPKGYGNVISLWVPEVNKQFIFGHLSQIGVSKGQEVPAGKIIGRTGSTGRSSAPHLHFEVHSNREYVGSRGAEDPTGYIPWLLLGGTKGRTSGTGGPDYQDPAINDNVKFAVKKLMNSKDIKLNDYEIAGWLGNFMTESPGLYPNRYQGDVRPKPTWKTPDPNGPGRGIAQWGEGKDGARWNNALKWWRKQNRKGDLFNSLEGQLDWAIEEITRGEFSNIAEIKNNYSKSVKEATLNFKDGFERPDKNFENIPERLAFANSVYQYIKYLRKLEAKKNKGKLPQKSFIDNILNFFKPKNKAEGGIEPPQKILVGEAGPEFIIPMSKIKTFMKLVADEKAKALISEYNIKKPVEFKVTNLQTKTNKIDNSMINYDYDIYNMQNEEVVYYYKPTIYYS